MALLCTDNFSKYFILNGHFFENTLVQEKIWFSKCLPKCCSHLKIIVKYSYDWSKMRQTQLWITTSSFYLSNTSISLQRMTASTSWNRSFIQYGCCWSIFDPSAHKKKCVSKKRTSYRYDFFLCTLLKLAYSSFIQIYCYSDKEVLVILDYNNTIFTNNIERMPLVSLCLTFQLNYSASISLSFSQFDNIRRWQLIVKQL